jgi:hypothetical protein
MLADEPRAGALPMPSMIAPIRRDHRGDRLTGGDAPE